MLDIASFHDTWRTWQQLQSHGHQPKISLDELRGYELREGRPCGHGVRSVAAKKRKSSASLHTRLAVNHGISPPAPGPASRTPSPVQVSSDPEITNNFDSCSGVG